MMKKMLAACLLFLALAAFAAAAFAACDSEEAHRYGSWTYKLPPVRPLGAALGQEAAA